MIIYKATNKINGKCYIGQTVRPFKKRLSQHRTVSKTSNYYIYRAIRKYGWDNFSWEVLCECSDMDELNEMEYHYIKLYGDYNLTDGGVGIGGYKHTEETRKQMSVNHPDISGKNNPMYGKTPSEHPAARQCILTDRKGNKHTGDCIKELCGSLGLQYIYIYRVLQGRRKTHKGWTAEYA